MNARDLEQILAFAGEHRGGAWLPMDETLYQCVKILDNTGRWALVLFTEDETRIAVHGLYPVTNVAAEDEIARSAGTPYPATGTFLHLLPPVIPERNPDEA